MKKCYPSLFRQTGGFLRKTIALFVITMIATQLYANALLQSSNISLSLRNATLSEVLNTIKKQAKCEIFYVSSDIANIKGITIIEKSITIEEALSKAIEGTNLTYTFKDNAIIISKIKVAPQNQQQKTKSKISLLMTVVEKETKKPISGATVIVERTGAGAITDESGKFLLIVDEGDVFDVSFIGMKSYKGVATNGSNKKIIELEQDNIKVEDVVITGYQTVSKRFNASATTNVDPQEINIMGEMSIENMLQGRVAGMMVMNTSGEPSATPRIRVRGNSTLSGNKAPVWVVDGIILEQSVPFNVSDINSDDAAYLIGNAIAGVNPNDIESITVLKDASATAIYGVKAANGVIVITTKKGKIGKPIVSYAGNMTVNISPSYDNFDRMNATERMQLSREIYDAGLNYPVNPRGDSYEALLDLYMKKLITREEFERKVIFFQERNTNWFDEFFRTNINHSHNVSVSGGTDKVRYYFSAGYDGQQGASIKSSSDRFTSLGKVDVEFNDRIKLSVKIDFNTTENIGYNTGVEKPFNYAYNTSRTMGTYDENGNLSFYNKGVGENEYNYLNELNQTGNNAITDKFGGFAKLDVKLIKGLTYIGTFSYGKSHTKQRNWATDKSYLVALTRGYKYNMYEEGSVEYNKSPLPYGGILEQRNNSSRNYVVRNDLNYVANFGKHALNAFVGIEARSTKYTGTGVTGYGWIPEFGDMFNPIMTDKYVSNLVPKTRPIITNTVTQVASFYGTLSYTFNEKYVLNGNIRSDGANKFGSNPKYRWLPTWSVAGRWFMKEEPFLKDVKCIDDISIRASYGIQGNIHDDSTPDLIVKTDGKDGNTLLNTSSIVRLPNPDLRWEKTKSWNTAIDFTLFDGRLRGSFDVYKKYVSDLIMNKQVSSSNGRSFIYINAGEMENFGFEGNIQVGVIRRKNFEWNVGLIFSRNTNNITYANGDAYNNIEDIDKMLNGDIAVEGAPVGSMFSFQYAGLSGVNGYPLFMTRDGRLVHEGNPILLNLVNSGSIYPILSGGINIDFRIFKNITVTAALTYNLGGYNRLPKIYEDEYKVFDPLRNVSRDIRQRWQKPGDEMFTNIPALVDKNIEISNDQKALLPNNLEFRRFTDLYNNADTRVAKADYIRLRSVTVGYDIPNSFTSKLKINGAKLFLQATNLGVWASKDWQGLDPEIRAGEIPMLPTFSLGLNLSF